MMYKALRSFTGKVSMYKNEIKEINDEAVANDLINAGYIVKIEIPEKVDLTGKPVKEEKKVKDKEILTKKKNK